MRSRTIVALLVSLLVFSAAACSSSSKSSSATKVPASEAKPVCDGVHEFQQVAANMGTTPADFKNDAVKLKAIAEQIRTKAPSSIAAPAKDWSSLMTTAADNVASQTSKASALQPARPARLQHAEPEDREGLRGVGQDQLLAAASALSASPVAATQRSRSSSSMTSGGQKAMAAAPIGSGDHARGRAAPGARRRR